MSEAATQVTIFTLCYEGSLTEVAPFTTEGAADDYALKCLAKCLQVPLSGDELVDWRAVRAIYDLEGCQYHYSITTTKTYAAAAELIREKWTGAEAAAAGVTATPDEAGAR